jgi:DDE superfamily endonuclease
LSNKKSLLILDWFRAHIRENTKRIASANKTVLAVILEGLTSQLLLLDILINKRVMQFLKEQWTKWMMTPEEQTQTQSRQIKKASISQISGLVRSAWESIGCD